MARLHGAQAALDMIAPLESALAGYFPYFGARGHFLLQLDRPKEARQAFDQAIALAGSPAEAMQIRKQLDRLTEKVS